VLINKQRRNEIFEALVAAGHDPHDFDVVNETVIHDASDSRLSVGHGGPRFVVKYNVGDADVETDWIPVWEAVVEFIVAWAYEIQHVAATPDLWAELRSEKKLFAPPCSPDDVNTPFTDAEKAQIRAQLDEVMHYAERTFDLSENGMRQLEEHLLYLREAADRLGRKDWRAIAISSVITLASEALVPANEVRHGR
jgi:hypothetical protein